MLASCDARLSTVVVVAAFDGSFPAAVVPPSWCPLLPLV